MRQLDDGRYYLEKDEQELLVAASSASQSCVEMFLDNFAGDLSAVEFGHDLNSFIFAHHELQKLIAAIFETPIPRAPELAPPDYDESSPTDSGPSGP